MKNRERLGYIYCDLAPGRASSSALETKVSVVCKRVPSCVVGF